MLMASFQLFAEILRGHHVGCFPTVIVMQMDVDGTKRTPATPDGRGLVVFMNLETRGRAICCQAVKKITAHPLYLLLKLILRK